MLLTVLRRAERSLQWPVALACGYETIAIVRGRSFPPTVSTLCSRHRWLIPAVVGGLLWHLVAMPRD